MNGLVEHLKKWGGKVPDRQIAKEIGCALPTVRKARQALGIPGYQGRPNWTRRDWLLNDAAGLYLDRESAIEGDAEPPDCGSAPTGRNL